MWNDRGVFYVTLSYLLESSDDRVPDTDNIDLDVQAAQGICEEYREMFLKYVRLSEKSRAIVDAAINGALRADKDAGDLLEDKLFYILVLDSESYQKRRRNRDEGAS